VWPNLLAFLVLHPQPANFISLRSYQHCWPTFKHGVSFDSVSAFTAGHLYLLLLLCRGNFRYEHKQLPLIIRILTLITAVGFYTRSLALVADAFHYV
jgi:hypothetical protein